MTEQTTDYVDFGENKSLNVSRAISATTTWIPLDQLTKNKMTECELLELLAAEIGLPDIEPDEVTAQLVADYTGVSWSKAAAVLKAKLAAGELTARQVRTRNGKPSTAYRKVG